MRVASGAVLASIVNLTRSDRGKGGNPWPIRIYRVPAIERVVSLTIAPAWLLCPYETGHSTGTQTLPLVVGDGYVGDSGLPLTLRDGWVGVSGLPLTHCQWLTSDQKPVAQLAGQNWVLHSLTRWGMGF